MSSTSPQPRPRQVTWAGWMIVLGSVFTVLTAWEVVSGIRSTESRDQIERFLASGPGGDLGIDVETAIGLLRGVVLVSAVCAAAAAVLGGFALKRHRGARIGLAVLALPMFLAGLATGGFLSSLVVVASVMLWLSPSREWFAGRPLPQPGQRPGRPRDDVDAWGVPRPPADGPGATAPGSAAPPASSPSGPFGVSGTVDPASGPPPSPRAFGEAGSWPTATAPDAPDAPAQRPGSVTAAAVVTWVVAGLVLLVSVITAIAMIGAGDLLLEEMERQQPGLVESSGVSRGALRSSVIAMGAALALASLTAMVLAVLLTRRRAWARTALLALSVGTAVLGVVSSLATFAAVIPAFGAIVVAAMLRRPEARAWFSTPPDPRG